MFTDEIIKYTSIITDITNNLSTITDKNVIKFLIYARKVAIFQLKLLKICNKIMVFYVKLNKFKY